MLGSQDKDTVEVETDLSLEGLSRKKNSKDAITDTDTDAVTIKGGAYYN